MIICIGAGPGDIAYLTQRGAELIRNADVVAGFDAVINVVQSLIPATAQTVLMNYRDQTEQLAQVAIALPVTIALAGGAPCLEETRWLTFCCQLLTTRLTRVLRFQSGKVRARAGSAAVRGEGEEQGMRLLLLSA